MSAVSGEMNAVKAAAESANNPVHPATGMWDLFISHASEDKEEFVRPLARELQERGLRIWYDEHSLSLGDSLQESIYKGLAESRFGVVVLSRHFLAKQWPQRELAGLTMREQSAGKIILPVWHGVSVEDVAKHFPTLADRLATDTANGVSSVADAIQRAVAGSPGVPARRPPPGKVLAELMHDLSPAQRKALQNAREVFRDANRRSFTLVLVGSAGVGKSSTVNTLFGRQVSRPSKYRVGTKAPKRFEGGEFEGITFSLVDTPGLGATRSEADDYAYLREIKRKVRRMDCMFLVARLDENRPAEERLAAQITEIFGEEIWDRTVVVFTFCDVLAHDVPEYTRQLKERTRHVRHAIAGSAGRGVAGKVPIIPVANSGQASDLKPRPLPTGEPWLGALYAAVFSRISDEGAVPFYLYNQRRDTGDDPFDGTGALALDAGQRQVVVDRMRNLGVFRHPHLVGADARFPWERATRLPGWLEPAGEEDDYGIFRLMTAIFRELINPR
ncbi:MAG TPA: TIR domain-containing protein [Longimicrobium sp.]|nr:TIR domain-containing protein [Longimicrobium sp.]